MPEGKAGQSHSVSGPPPYDCAVTLTDDEASKNTTDEPSKGTNRLKKISRALAAKMRSDSGDFTEAAAALVKQTSNWTGNKKKQKEHDICTFAESPKTLFRNVKNNQLEAVRKVYLKVPERILCRNELGETLLHVAAAEGHLDMVHFLLDCEGIKIDEQDDTNWNTPMHFAVQRSQLTVIDYLILKGARTDVLNRRYMAPIHLATEYNLVDSLRELVKHSQVDPNLPGENDAPPIHNASANNLVECALVLLENGALPNKPNASGLHSVHVAAKNGAKEVIEVLVQHAENKGLARKQIINSPDRDGNVPLHAAVDSGNIDALRVCLEAGADIDVQQEDKSTPVHFACARKEIAMVKLMFALQPEKKNTVLSMRDVNGMTPLHRAVMLDHEVIVEYLLDEGAKIEVPDLHGRTPLLLAAANCASHVIALLIKRGVNVFQRDEAGRNFIHLAVINRMSFDDLKFGGDDIFVEKMRILLNERDNHGSTPLHYASGDGLLQTIERLLINGAEIAIRNNDRDTALHFAACHGRYNSCRRLLDSPSGPFIINVQDCNGRSALFVAAENGHTRVVDLLLLKGALFHRDNSGQTVLHAAAKNGHMQTVQLLLGANASLVNAIAVCGDTALHLAAKNGHVDTVILLMSRGAEFNVNKDGKSFLHEAIFCNHEEVTRAILQHDRWQEAMEVTSDKFVRPTKYLIELMPSAAMILLDNCTIPNEKPESDVDYQVEYDLRFVEPPRHAWSIEPASPLPALNAMINCGRFELLGHPLSQSVLKMKWETYGRITFYGKMAIWLLYVVLLTYFIILSNPLCHDHLMESALRSCNSNRSSFSTSNSSTYNNSFSDNGMNDYRVNNTADDECMFRLEMLREECAISCPSRIACLYLIFIISMLDLIHNAYCLCSTNFDVASQMWAPAIAVVRVAMLFCSLTFLTPVIISGDYYIPHHWQWNMGIAAMSLSWIHLFLYLQLENTVGIYVVMFMEIMKTIIRASLIFEIMLCGFGFTFHVLLKYDMLTDPNYTAMESTNTYYTKLKHTMWTPGHVALSAFKSPVLSLLKVVLMMTGELDFLDTFTTPLEDDNEETLHFPAMTYILLAIFVLCVPIVLMNMLLGLALGNIEAVLKNASLKKICMQVQLHTEIERSTPHKVFKFFRQPSSYLDRPRATKYAGYQIFNKLVQLYDLIKKKRSAIYEEKELNTHKKSTIRRRRKQSVYTSSGIKSSANDSERDLQSDAKFTNKEICILLERQTEMLRSVMQHLKIGSADLEELEDDQLASYLNSRQTKRSKTVFKSTVAQVTASASVLRKWQNMTSKTIKEISGPSIDLSESG